VINTRSCILLLRIVFFYSLHKCKFTYNCSRHIFYIISLLLINYLGYLFVLYDLSGPKHLVSRITNTFVGVNATPPFLIMY
jgi:hypothetical protein